MFEYFTKFMDIIFTSYFIEIAEYISIFGDFIIIIIVIIIDSNYYCVKFRFISYLEKINFTEDFNYYIYTNEYFYLCF